MALSIFLRISLTWLGKLLLKVTHYRYSLLIVKKKLVIVTRYVLEKVTGKRYRYMSALLFKKY